MPNTLKKYAVKNLRTKLSKAKSLILTDFTGLNANQSNDLRKRIADSGGEVLVAKNSLIKIALKEEKIESKELNNDFTGQIATIIAYEDSVAPIKVLFEFIKTLEAPKISKASLQVNKIFLRIKGALIDGVYNTAQMVEVLSKLPSRIELLTKVVSSLKSPLVGITNVLNGPQRKLVYVMQAISEKKKEVS